MPLRRDGSYQARERMEERNQKKTNVRNDLQAFKKRCSEARDVSASASRYGLAPDLIHQPPYQVISHLISVPVNHDGSMDGYMI
jgi:hypothetical protein